MKSLSLSSPHVVVMVGVPGSGKSFFAERFSKTFSTPMISWGAIRDELFNEPAFSKDEDVIVERMADLLLTEMMKTRATIIYEGDMLTQVSRKNLTKKLRQDGYEPLFVWVQTDSAAARTRALKRGRTNEQHDAALKKFTPPKDKEPFVVISGKHTYASQLKIVLRRLSSARAAAADRASRVSKSIPVRRTRIQ